MNYAADVSELLHDLNLFANDSARLHSSIQDNTEFLSMQVLKSDGASTPPCLTPVCTGKKPDVAAPHFTALSVPEYRAEMRRTRHGGSPRSSSSLHRASLLTESNAFLKSI